MSSSSWVRLTIGGPVPVHQFLHDLPRLSPQTGPFPDAETLLRTHLTATLQESPTYPVGQWRVDEGYLIFEHDEVPNGEWPQLEKWLRTHHISYHRETGSCHRMWNAVVAQYRPHIQSLNTFWEGEVHPETLEPLIPLHLIRQFVTPVVPGRTRTIEDLGVWLRQHFPNYPPLLPFYWIDDHGHPVPSPGVPS